MARLPYEMPYDSNFLGDGFEVPLPQACCKGKLLNDGEVFHYIHFSLVMHQDRRMALYTAHNIDFSQKRSARRTGWNLDPRIDTQNQVGNEAYRNNDWDRGHLVRRDAVVWGSSDSEAQDASDSTFFYPVANLQHSRFNQGNSKWLGLEDWILQKAGAFAARLCVFTGPIYTDVDVEERGVKVPAAFFKIVVLRDPTADGQDLAALGFIMKQNENWRRDGRRALTNLEPYHVSIAEIEAYTGLNFGAIADVDEFDWRQIRFRNRALMPAIQVDGPADIVFSGARRRARGIRARRRFANSDERNAAIGNQRTAMPTITKPQRDCGCQDEHINLKAEIKALKAQTTALYEIIETLMENNLGNFSRAAVARMERILPRIVGGNIVAPGEFPHCVAVGNNSQYFCTGILVHPEVVLTAAHCADFPITKVFLKGRQLSDIASGEVRDVAQVIVHPDYNENQIPWNDIAVLILAQPASNDIPTVPIASKAEVAADDALTLVGFGSDSPNGQTGFGTKRKVNVGLTKTSDLPAAAVIAKQQELGYDVSSEFHGGDFRSGQDTCRGDSGGPAYIVTGDNTLKVAGLTSRAAAIFEQMCGDGGIYTLIAAFSPWLAEVTDGRLNAPAAEEEEDNELVEPPTETTKGGLYISAALPNPAGPDPGNEWVEITNSSTTPINLNKHWIADKQGGRLPLQGTIDPSATIRIIIPKNHAIKLANKGDEIKLHQEDGSIHEVSYPNAGSGQVIVFQSPYNEETAGGGTGGNPCEEPDDTNPPGCDEEIDEAFTPGAIRC